MPGFRNTGLLILVSLAVVAGLVTGGSSPGTFQAEAAGLPPGSWWLVIHHQCNDTLHWISPSGEYASIPRPPIPNEAPAAPCSYRPMRLSYDGRYLVQTGLLTNGLVAIGFYDLQMGVWMQIHQAQLNELAYLGDRYSVSSANHIAVGFAHDASAPPGWRVIVFDMATGDALSQLRSDGPEIVGFVGGEFLAVTATIPHVLLVAEDTLTGTYFAHIRFDALDPALAPYGSLAWYPAGAPGVTQTLFSSPYTATDIDMLPSRDAVYAYNDAAFAAGPPVGVAPDLIDTNAIGMMRPLFPADIAPAPQLFFADGVHTLYRPQWAADGAITLFRLSDGTAEQLRWVRTGTAIVNTITEPISQVIGVPTGFVYSTSAGIFYLETPATTPTGPVFSDLALSGGMAFVWATGFGNPALALDTPAMPGSTPPSLPTPSLPTPIPGATPVPAAGQADLFVSEFSLSPATPVQGQPVNVRVGVYNGGSVNAPGPFRIEWYPGEGYPTPGCNWTLDGMVARGGQILTCTYAGYPSWYASINTRVLIDTTNVVTESNEANNGYSLAIAVSVPAAPTPASQPDLFISEFSLNPATPVQGQPVEVRVGVYNGGPAAVSGSFRVEWYPGESYSSPGCNWTLDSLAAGGGRILTCTYAGYPSWYASINTKVLADTTNAIAESNESNNSFVAALAVTAPATAAPPGQPDLFVSEFSLNPATPVQGQPVEVRVGVYNQGTAAASSSFRVEWYPGENFSSPGCNWTVDSMAARGGRILTCTYAGYPSWYGSINTKVAVDTTNTIAESNEGNNTFLQAISVSQP